MQEELVFFYLYYLPQLTPCRLLLLPRSAVDFGVDERGLHYVQLHEPGRYECRIYASNACRLLARELEHTDADGLEQPLIETKAEMMSPTEAEAQAEPEADSEASCIVAAFLRYHESLPPSSSLLFPSAPPPPPQRPSSSSAAQASAAGVCANHVSNATASSIINSINSPSITCANSCSPLSDSSSLPLLSLQSVSDLMPRLSRQLGLSRTYTNASIRATRVHDLVESGDLPSDKVVLFVGLKNQIRYVCALQAPIVASAEALALAETETDSAPPATSTSTASQSNSAPAHLTVSSSTSRATDTESSSTGVCTRLPSLAASELCSHTPVTGVPSQVAARTFLPVEASPSRGPSSIKPSIRIKIRCPKASLSSPSLSHAQAQSRVQTPVPKSLCRFREQTPSVKSPLAPRTPNSSSPNTPIPPRTPAVRADKDAYAMDSLEHIDLNHFMLPVPAQMFSPSSDNYAASPALGLGVLAPSAALLEAAAQASATSRSAPTPEPIPRRSHQKRKRKNSNPMPLRKRLASSELLERDELDGASNEMCSRDVLDAKQSSGPFPTKRARGRPKGSVSGPRTSSRSPLNRHIRGRERSTSVRRSNSARARNGSGNSLKLDARPYKRCTKPREPKPTVTPEWSRLVQVNVSHLRDWLATEYVPSRASSSSSSALLASSRAASMPRTTSTDESPPPSGAASEHSRSSSLVDTQTPSQSQSQSQFTCSATDASLGSSFACTSSSTSSVSELEFEGWSEQELGAALAHYFRALRTRNGQLYSPSTLVQLRSEIQYHLNSPPYSRHVKLNTGIAFAAASRVIDHLTRLYNGTSVRTCKLT